MPPLHDVLHERVRVRVQNVVRQRVLLLNDALAVALVVLEAAGRPGAADLHLDLGEPVLQLPLLLVQLDAHRGVLGLDGVQSLAESLDLGLQGFVRAEQRRRGARHQLGHAVALQRRTWRTGIINTTV